MVFEKYLPQEFGIYGFRFNPPSEPIPKKEIFRVMQEIRRIRLTAPVKIGQVVIEDVCGLGSDVIVTKEMG